MSTPITDMTYELPAAWDIGGWLGFIRYINVQDARTCAQGGPDRWHIANDNDPSAVSDPHGQSNMFGAAQPFARRFFLTPLPRSNIRYLRGRLASREGAAL